MLVHGGFPGQASRSVGHRWLPGAVLRAGVLRARPHSCDRDNSQSSRITASSIIVMHRSQGRRPCSGSVPRPSEWRPRLWLPGRRRSGGCRAHLDGLSVQVERRPEVRMFNQMVEHDLNRICHLPGGPACRAVLDRLAAGEAPVTDPSRPADFPFAAVVPVDAEVSVARWIIAELPGAVGRRGRTHAHGREAVPPRRLASTWCREGSEAETRVPLASEPVEAGRTRPTLTHSRFARDGTRDAHVQDRTGRLARPEAYWAG